MYAWAGMAYIASKPPLSESVSVWCNYHNTVLPCFCLASFRSCFFSDDCLTLPVMMHRIYRRKLTACIFVVACF